MARGSMPGMLGGILHRLGSFLQSQGVVVEEAALPQDHGRRGRVPSLSAGANAEVLWTIPDTVAPGAGRRVVVSGSSEVYDVVPEFCWEKFVLGVPTQLVSMLIPRLQRRLSNEPDGSAFVLQSLPDRPDARPKGRMDATLHPLAPAPPQVGHPVLFDRYVCVLRSDHPALFDGELTLEGYMGSAHVQIARNSWAGGHLEASLSSRGIARRFTLPIRPGVDLAFMVQQCDVIATVPATAAQTLADAPGLTRVEFPGERLDYTVFMRWQANMHGNVGHVRLRNIVSDAINEIAG